MAQKPATMEPDRVLVVDADPTLRGSVAEVLRTGGHVVSEALDDEDALRQVHAGGVTLLVLDLGASDTGFSLLDRIEHPPPVILMSAKRAVKHNDPRVSSLLYKPFDPVLMLETAGEVTRSGRAENGA